MQVELFEWRVAHGDVSVLRGVKSEEEFDERGLAAAACAYYGRHASIGNGEADVAESLSGRVFVVAETYVEQSDAVVGAVEGCKRATGVFVRTAVHFVDAFQAKAHVL